MPTLSGISPSPVPSNDVCMETSADKRTRESPDTTTRPEGKSLKTSGVSSSSKRYQSSVPDIDTSDDRAGQAEGARQPAGTRKLANSAPEARLQIRQLHTRVPTWKLPLCVQALNARPIDLDHIAEVTDIRFANEELVTIAAKCSADLSGESDLTGSAGQATGCYIASVKPSGKGVLVC